MADFTVERAGVTLAGEEAGEGIPVVLLHGLTATRRYVVMGSRAPPPPGGPPRAPHPPASPPATPAPPAPPGPPPIRTPATTPTSPRTPAPSSTTAGSSARCWPAP